MMPEHLAWGDLRVNALQASTGPCEPWYVW